MKKKPASLLFLIIMVLAATTPSMATTSSSMSGPPAVTGGSALYDLNSVNFEELQTIRGIGPALAERILDYRALHGPFTRIDELLQVKGIGEKSLARFRKLFSLSPPPSPVATTPTDPPR